MSTTDRLKQISELLSMAADGRGHDLVVELTAAAAVIDNMVSTQLADAKKYDALLVALKQALVELAHDCPVLAASTIREALAKVQS